MITYFILWMLQDAMPTPEQLVINVVLDAMIIATVAIGIYVAKKIYRAIKLTKEGCRYGRKTR